MTETLRAKRILHQHDLVKIKELRAALAAEILNREEGPQIVPLRRGR